MIIEDIISIPEFLKVLEICLKMMEMTTITQGLSKMLTSWCERISPVYKLDYSWCA